MEDWFEIELKQTEKDKSSDNNRKRFSRIIVPNNSSLKELKIQLPIAYEGPRGTNNLEKVYTPEHFFLMGITGCFFTTFSVVSSNSNMNYKNLQIEAKGLVGTSTGVKIMEKIEQTINLIVSSSVSKKKALRVLELTEKRCPLANSVKSKINNSYNVILEDE
ncbi:MAG: hypothetical protein GF383_12650 [Candidatus Lokiarchaeota archaeon]|nr:hypothetical protein [Candidatus Lokiarchaeota archaeon]MBD3341908.1 hypothetical protein [Candidatus Lokiarchaeota archaeon]